MAEWGDIKVRKILSIYFYSIGWGDRRRLKPSPVDLNEALMLECSGLGESPGILKDVEVTPQVFFRGDVFVVKLNWRGLEQNPLFVDYVLQMGPSLLILKEVRVDC